MRPSLYTLILLVIAAIIYWRGGAKGGLYALAVLLAALSFALERAGRGRAGFIVATIAFGLLVLGLFL